MSLFTGLDWIIGLTFDLHVHSKNSVVALIQLWLSQLQYNNIIVNESLPVEEYSYDIIGCQILESALGEID